MFTDSSMRHTSPSPAGRGRHLRLFAAVFCCVLGAALWLATPTAAHAQTPIVNPEPNTKPCSSCHSDEAAAWDNSPHAGLVDPATGHALATCTTCHGDYVRGHPDEDSVPLKVDSSSCKSCHEETWNQWEQSTHGDAGVQCISCHLVHSQTMRISDDRLCTSCHRETLDDSMHQAHQAGTATCTDCHMAESTAMTQAVANAGGQPIAAHAPDHDFVSVSASKCLECHRGDVTKSAAGAATVKASTPTAVATASAAATPAEKINSSLAVMSVANLGFGIGIGGILGILFMIAYARFGNRRNS